MNQAKRRFSELDKLIASVYEDKVSERISEEVCFSLPDKYQAEKNSLKDEISALERKASDTEKEQSDVDECPGKYSKQPREIHIYYKLINKTASKEQFQSWENNK